MKKITCKEDIHVGDLLVGYWFEPLPDPLTHMFLIVAMAQDHVITHLTLFGYPNATTTRANKMVTNDVLETWFDPTFEPHEGLFRL